MSELELRQTRVAASADHLEARGRRFPLPSTLLAGAFVIFLGVSTVFPALVWTQEPNAIEATEAFEAPSLAHWFGTDESGRDVYSRVIAGTGTSLLIGVSATSIGLLLGLVLGVLASFGGRVLDFGVNRVIEVMFAFPGLLLALLVIVVYGPGPVTATVAVGLSTAPGYARIIRSRLLSIRSSHYVEAARVLGHPASAILARHVLPNALLPIFVLATLGVGQAIVWASALSYLGLGAQPPAAEWGAMLAAGRTYLAGAWWLTVFPGLMIVATTIATTVLGRALVRHGSGQR